MFLKPTSLRTRFGRTFGSRFEGVKDRPTGKK